MQTISCTVQDAVKASGLSRTSIYSLIGDGKLETTKIGRRRLVIVSSLESLIRGSSQDA